MTHDLWKFLPTSIYDFLLQACHSLLSLLKTKKPTAVHLDLFLKLKIASPTLAVLLFADSAVANPAVS